MCSSTIHDSSGLCCKRHSREHGALLHLKGTSGAIARTLSRREDRAVLYAPLLDIRHTVIIAPSPLIMLEFSALDLVFAQAAGDNAPKLPKWRAGTL
jgi:hypothetical protein